MTPLNRIHLTAMACATPGCKHDECEVFFHGRCHPSAGSRVSYVKKTGQLHVVCRECKTPIATIEIADGKPM